MAVSDTWVRVRGTANIGGLSTDIDLADIPLNDTLLRVHAGFSVIAQVPGVTGPSIMLGSHWAAGIYTRVTTGGANRNALTQASDANPPLERWLWWENLVPHPAPVPNLALPDTPQVWYLTPAFVPLDIKSKVASTTAVSLHLAISVDVLPVPVIDIHAWYWASILRSGL